MEKVIGTRYLVAKTIKTTRVETLVTGAPIGMQGKHRGKSSVTGSHQEPTILRMMQIGIIKTHEEALPYELSLLAI